MKHLLITIAAVLLVGCSKPEESYSITFPLKSKKLVMKFDLYSDGSTSISAKEGPHKKYQDEKGSWELKGSTMTLLVENQMLLVFNTNTLDVSEWYIFGESFNTHRLDLVRN